jgi:hypothetical protein
MPARRSSALIALLLLLGCPLAAGAAVGLVDAAMAFSPPACGGGPPFSDISPSDPLCPWIRQAKADGIVNACGGDTFCPDAPVTRGQLALVVERAMRGTGDWDPWRGSYQRTLIVNPVLAGNPPVVEPAASGQHLRDVLESIPADGDGYLVKLEPGDYDIGPGVLSLRSQLRLEGSGERRTRILAAPTSHAAIEADGVIVELADLAIVVTASTGTRAALYDTDSSLRLERVAVDITSAGVAYGLEIGGNGFVTVRDSSLRAAAAGNLAAGIYQAGASTTLRMDRSTVTGSAFFDGANGLHSRGILLDDGTLELTDSRLNAQAGTSTNYALALTGGAQATVRGGGGRAGSGTATVLFVSDSQLDVDGGEWVAYSGTATRAARCLGSGSIDLVRTRLFGVSAIYGAVGCPVDVSFSQLQGAVNENGGVVDCRAVTDSANNFLASICP